MKVVIAMVLIFFTINVFANVHVRGHWRKNGTYVSSHSRSNPHHKKH